MQIKHREKSEKPNVNDRARYVNQNVNDFILDKDMNELISHENIASVRIHEYSITIWLKMKIRRSSSVTYLKSFENTIPWQWIQFHGCG